MLRYIETDPATGRLVGVADEGFHLGPNEQLIELPDDFVMEKVTEWVLGEDGLRHDPLPKPPVVEPTVPLDQQVAELQATNETQDSRLTEIENSFTALMGGIADAYAI